MIKRLLQLSRTKLGILTISISVVVALMLILVNVYRNNQPSETTLVFCEEYPEALICTEEEYTTVEIAYDMFDEILDRYPDDMDETFCTLYFTGTLLTYCLEDLGIIFPPRFHVVSEDYYLEEVQEGIYDVLTQYSSGNPAYLIRFAFTEMDGVYMVSGLSFVDAPPIIDLAMTPADINTFMIAMIQASTNQPEDFCTTYFVAKAMQDCQSDSTLFVFDDSAIHNYDIVSVITNDYFYLVRTEDGSVTYQYHVAFIEENSTIVISDLSVKELE